MKIAFVAPYDFSIPGGVKNHVCGLAENLIIKGNDVSILGVASHSISGVPNFIKLGDFPKARRLSFAPHWRVSPWVAKRLHTVLRKERFDVIHIHEPLIPPLCLSALLCSNTPLFATFHTYYEKGQILYDVFQPILKQLVQRLHGRITVSQSAKEYINRYFPYEYKVIPNGIDVRRFRSSRAGLSSKEQINLLFVGHQRFARKGLKYLIEAYAILKKEYPKLHLTVVGANWFGAKGSLLDDTIAQNDISFLGMVSDQELIDLYQAADVFCAPSIGNESFGIVLLEAMAARVPIVSTSIKGYGNVIQDEYNALIVPPKDSRSLAGAIKRLIENPLLAQKLVSQAELTVEKYAWDHVADEIMGYYLEKLPNGI